MSENNKGSDFDPQNFMSLFLNPDVPFNYKFFFIAALLIYTVSPIDILPEALLGPIGFADDATIWVVAAQLFTNLANRKLKQDHAEDEDIQTVLLDDPPALRAQGSTAPNNTRLPDHHVERHHAPQPAAPISKVNDDVFSDEQHERLIRQKKEQARAEFDEKMQGGVSDEAGWDPSRNDPFQRKSDPK
jgi:uncharacterized membrane protein YkvA (DUF1232 family)